MSTGTKANAPAQTEPMAHDLGKIRVGRLPTMNQDECLGLSEWWVQLRIGEDGEEVLARVYGNTPEQAHSRATALAAQAEQALKRQTLEDVMAGIPARDAEIAALRKEIETLQAAQAQQYVSGGNLADRLDVLADTASPGSQMQSDLYAAATIWRKHLKGPAAQQPVSGADDIEFLVRVLEQVSAWLPEDWSEFLERNPAVVDMLRPMVNHQTQQDADKVDAALAEMVHAMFRSGNSVPVTRITIDRKQYDAAIDAARKEQA